MKPLFCPQKIIIVNKLFEFILAQYTLKSCPIKQQHFFLYNCVCHWCNSASKMYFTVLHIWQMIPLHLFHSFHMDLPPSWLFRNRFLELVLHLLYTHNVLHIYWTHRWSIDCCSSASSRPAGGAVLTLSPQCDALLLVCLADAVVTVSIHTLTGVSVVQVDISGTVRIDACAKLRQITGVTGLTARSPCRLQLHNKHDKYCMKSFQPIQNNSLLLSQCINIPGFIGID